jgi:hypothetical protein
MRVHLFIAALSLACGNKAASAQPASGEPVDPAVTKSCRR